MDNMKDLIDLNPCTFCLNDYQNITTDINNAHINYLQQNFPNKSEFEK